MADITGGLGDGMEREDAAARRGDDLDGLLEAAASAGAGLVGTAYVAVRTEVARAWETLRRIAERVEADCDERARCLGSEWLPTPAQARDALGRMEDKFGATAEYDERTRMWLVHPSSGGAPEPMTDAEFGRFRADVAEMGMGLTVIQPTKDGVCIRHEFGGVLHSDRGAALTVIRGGAVDSVYALHGLVMDPLEWEQRRAPPAEPTPQRNAV